MKQETIATHYAYDNAGSFGAMSVPIFQTTAYNFFTSETAANRFALKELGQIYTRLTNPTTDVFEARMAAMENAKAAIALSSGQSATFSSIINLTSIGDNILVSDKVYGGTSTLLSHTFKRFGVEVRLFDCDDLAQLENLIDENTKAIFAESISNPQTNVCDCKAIADIADKYGVVSIIDNTVATPALYNPTEDGIDVVVHSASKYISGQGLCIAGVVVASNNLNNKLVSNKRYPHFNEPDESYHGLIYANLPLDIFDIYTLRIRLSILRDIGLSLSPFNSFLLIQGLETLNLRMSKHSENALKIAKFLQSHDKIKSVTYPGLDGANGNHIIKSKFKNSQASGILSFEVKDFKTAESIINKVKIFSIVVNIGDTKSIITHPASTTHQQLSEEELLKAKISKGLIRLSVGIEDSQDLIQDLKKALNDSK